MSNFRSILSSFQEATGTSSSSSTSQSRSSTSASKRLAQRNTNVNCNGKDSSKTPVVVARKEDIEQLWRTSQIQSSFRAASASAAASATSAQSSTSSDDKAIKKSPIHVAICATIVSDLPHEHLWRSWSSHRPNNDASKSTSASSSASIHVHAKTPNAIRSGTWLKSRLIPISHNPNWNDYRIIRAMLSLAEYAIQYEPQTTHLMMVTESCIPIDTLDELSNIIHREGMQHSFLDVYGIHSSRCTRFDEHSCFAIDGVPKDAIYKALPGWALFSRSHMEEVIHLRGRLKGGGELYPLFKSVWAPEEVFFPTALALLGKLSVTNDKTNEVVRRSLLWSKWDERSRGSDRAHPIVYDGQFSRELIDEAKKKGCVFMRKWKKRVDVRQWEKIVLGIDEESRHGALKRMRESGTHQSSTKKAKKN